MNTSTIIANLAVAIAMTTGLVQVIKTAGLSSRFAPLVALAIGVLAVFLLSNGIFSFEVVSTGIIAGLSSMGLYAGTKTIAGQNDKVTVPLASVQMTAPSDTPVDVQG